MMPLKIATIPITIHVNPILAFDFFVFEPFLETKDVSPKPNGYTGEILT